MAKKRSGLEVCVARSETKRRSIRKFWIPWDGDEGRGDRREMMENEVDGLGYDSSFVLL